MFFLLADFEVLIIALIFISIDFIPTFLLTANYLTNSQGLIFRIRSDKIEIKKNGELIVISNYGIQKIKIVYTKHRADNKISFVAASWEYYYYGAIILKTGEQYLFTCLNGFSFEKRLKKMKGVLFDKEVRFPIIKNETK